MGGAVFNFSSKSCRWRGHDLGEGSIFSGVGPLFSLVGHFFHLTGHFSLTESCQEGLRKCLATSYSLTQTCVINSLNTSLTSIHVPDLSYTWDDLLKNVSTEDEFVTLIMTCSSLTSYSSSSHETSFHHLRRNESLILRNVLTNNCRDESQILKHSSLRCVL